VGEKVPLPRYLNLDARAIPGKVHIVAHLCWLPLRTESVEEIFSEHTFEHLGRDEILPALKECLRVLKTSGRIEIRVPDFRKVVDLYLKYGFGVDPQSGLSVLTLIFGGQRHPWDYHRTAFDWPTLRKLLKEAGFSNIVRLPDDQPDRFRRTANLWVEARKPL